jgi:hypothetical protein
MSGKKHLRTMSYTKNALEPCLEKKHLRTMSGKKPTLEPYLGKKTH